jgi:hypothetical protein
MCYKAVIIVLYILVLVITVQSGTSGVGLGAGAFMAGEGSGVLCLIVAYCFSLQFDGCLFYHKQAHYTFGASPLVVWLKPYMVGELLGIEIPDCMLQQKPANYSTYAAHMQQVKDRKEHFAKELEEKKAHRKQKRGQDRSKQFKMDVSQECDVSDTSISNEGNISKSSVNDSNVSEDMEHQGVANSNNVT